MARRSEAILRIFQSVPTNAPDLTELYGPEMEVQVNVSPEGGEPVEGRRNTWSNGEYRWFHFRMPKNAKTNPEPNDLPQRFPIQEHATDIGMTGHDFGNHCSRWVAFDFDAVVDHEGTGISEEKLARIQEAVLRVPWIELRRSTSGSGLHLYVFFDPEDPPHTANHTEHAALGRAVLDKLSEVTGLDLKASVDVCGQNIWIWSRRATPENQGLTPIKKAEEPLRDVPANWRDYLAPAPKARSDIPDFLLAAQPRVELDLEHQSLIDWLRSNRHVAVWQEDQNSLLVHTRGLAAAHEALSLKGAFQTTSPGTDLAQPNAFLFPCPDGAWKVYRFGQNVAEAPTWQTTPNGWVGCAYNSPSDLPTLVKANGGFELPKAGFGFARVEDGLKFLCQLGVSESLPEWVMGRPMTFRMNADRRRLDGYIEYHQQPDAERKSEMTAHGWFLGSRPVQFCKVIDTDITARKRPATFVPAFERYDGIIRNVVSERGGEVGWLIKHDDGQFMEKTKSDVKDYLHGDGLNPDSMAHFLRDAMRSAWRQVNEPFADEYSGDRRWNRLGAQLAFEPADQGGDHPSWDMIFDHCGAGLDEAIAQSPWACANGVKSGGDFLRLWLALVLRKPKHRLPYLCLYSPEQGTGKSTLAASIRILFRDGRGFAFGDQALQSEGGFNGELDGAVIVAVEETDLSTQARRAYNRVKNLVTGDEILIHTKGETVYTARNFTHWLQTCNDIAYLPVFEGDSRVIVIKAKPITGRELSWDEELKPRLLAEAPRFLKALFDLKLPAPMGRLWLPLIETEAKLAAIHATEGERQDEAPRVDHDRLAEAIFTLLLIRDLASRVAVPAGPGGPAWEGAATDLLGALQEGPWPTAAPRFGTELRKAKAQLAKFGVNLSFVPPTGKNQRPRLETAEEFDRHWTDEEIVADLEYEAASGHHQHTNEAMMN